MRWRPMRLGDHTPARSQPATPPPGPLGAVHRPRSRCRGRRVDALGDRSPPSGSRLP